MYKIYSTKIFKHGLFDVLFVSKSLFYNPFCPAFHGKICEMSTFSIGIQWQLLRASAC